MIAFLDGRLVIACDTCDRAIDRPADGVVVRWASRAALVAHKGDCLVGLRTQYPSTATTAAIELCDALEQLAGAAGADDQEDAHAPRA
jgi:hypothetical protein